MQRNCWLLGFIVLAYIWHAGLELLDRYLEKWFEKHPRVQEGVFATGAMLLLPPACYYGIELYNTLHSLAPSVI